MKITVNIYYTGKEGNARKFAEEMISLGIVSKIREKQGNLGYQYYFSVDDPETVLLIDSWKDQEAIDLHHKSELMPMIAQLRTKYKLHMRVERYIEEPRK